MADDLREKNKEAVEKQKVTAAKKLKQAETTEQIYAAKPDDLRSQLSNKNEEYVFKLNKYLLDDGFKEDEAKEAIDKMMPEIVDNQIKGVPANQLYGPVTKKLVRSFTQPKKLRKHHSGHLQ